MRIWSPSLLPRVESSRWLCSRQRRKYSRESLALGDRALVPLQTSCSRHRWVRVPERSRSHPLYRCPGRRTSRRSPDAEALHWGEELAPLRSAFQWNLTVPASLTHEVLGSPRVVVGAGRVHPPHLGGPAQMDGSFQLYCGPAGAQAALRWRAITEHDGGVVGRRVDRHVVLGEARLGCASDRDGYW